MEANIYDLLEEECQEENPSDSLLKSAYQVLKKRQRPLPKQYFFPISNKETKLSRPPLPCKVCSSPKHWDKECPYWEKYLEKVKKKTTQMAAILQLKEDTKPEDAYHTVY